MKLIITTPASDMPKDSPASSGVLVSAVAPSEGPIGPTKRLWSLFMNSRYVDILLTTRKRSARLSAAKQVVLGV